MTGLGLQHVETWTILYHRMNPGTYTLRPQLYETTSRSLLNQLRQLIQGTPNGLHFVMGIDVVHGLGRMAGDLHA